MAFLSLSAMSRIPWWSFRKRDKRLRYFDVYIRDVVVALGEVDIIAVTVSGQEKYPSMGFM